MPNKADDEMRDGMWWEIAYTWIYKKKNKAVSFIISDTYYLYMVIYCGNEILNIFVGYVVSY